MLSGLSRNRPPSVLLITAVEPVVRPVCKACGCVADREANDAINILAAGITATGPSTEPQRGVLRQNRTVPSHRHRSHSLTMSLLSGAGDVRCRASFGARSSARRMK